MPPSPALGAVLGKVFVWLASNWLNLIKVFLAVGVGVGVGSTIFQYVTALQRPEAQQAMTSAVALVNAMMPLMMYFMMFQLMLTFTSMIREMVPRPKEKE
jgi:hypothetical protein